MDKLYEATYVVYDGEHEYLIKDRYWAPEWNNALWQYAEEMQECYGGHEDEWFDTTKPFLKVETYDGRVVGLLNLVCIHDVNKLVRACQLAFGYIESLPIRPMWERDDRAHVLQELVEAAA